MKSLIELWQSGSGRAMLLVGALLLYIASRAAVDALAGDSSGQRAVGHWIPIAAAALVATAMRRGDLALAIIFSTSVASLSLVAGWIFIVAHTCDAPSAFGRRWLFVFPAAMLTLLAGFAGQLKWGYAVPLLAEGAVLLLAWRELSGEAGENLPPTAPVPLRWVNLGLCIGLAVVGAILGVLGVTRLAREFPRLSDVTTVVAALAPLLVLPMLVAGLSLAHEKRPWVATTTGAGVVLLNLCLLLPLVILLWYPVNAVHYHAGLMIPWRMEGLANVPALVFPWVTWRVDNVVLVLLGFILVPAALGRWRLGRAEGMVLIGLYVVYVFIEAISGMRS